MTTDSVYHSDASFLKIDSVEKSFDGVQILSDINVDVEEGEFLVLVGPSGCGKSTLLNLLAGFEAPTTGDISIGGKSMLGLHPSKRDIAMVFQSYALYPNMNVERNIGFGMETRGVPKAERQAKIAEVADILQIGQLLKRKPAQLSGGQRQRVAMGRALVRDPRVFLFDEPLSNLDARLRVDMRMEIKKLHDRLGTTIVYVTHDQIEAMTLATKIVVLNQGNVQQSGTPDDIYNRPANEFVADFMGSPAMNKVKARLATEGDNVVVDLLGQRITLNDAPASLREHAARQSTVSMGIRAEDIVLRQGNTDANENTLTLPVSFIEPTGSDTFVTVQHTDDELVCRIANDVKPVIGERVNLSLNETRLHFFSLDTTNRID